MAKSFRDLAQDLRSKPGTRLPNGRTLDRVWIVQDTQPAASYGACIESTSKAVTKAIAIANPAGIAANADYSLGITGSWGSTFVVRVGGTMQDTSARLCLPAGITQSQLLARLYERMASEHSVCPSYTSGGALAIFNTSGTEVVATVPGGFFSLASGTANFVSPKAAEKYRIGAPHPDCSFLRLFGVESSGRDDHSVNLTLFYRVDMDLLAVAIGTTADALRSRTGYEITEPHDSPTYPRVQWTFEILNPEAYNRPANGTAHPWVAGAILTNETRSESQGAHMVTRIYEPIPGPVISTNATSEDGFNTTIQQKRVLRDSPGAPPSAPGGQIVMRQTLADDASLYAAAWVVESRSTVTRTESTSISAEADGITTREQSLQPTQKAAGANTVSLSNDVQSRGATGSPALYSSTQADYQLPSGPPLSINVNFRPGVTLRSTTNIVATPNERQDVADYQNSIATRNTSGSPIAWREQVTTSAFRPTIAGTEKDHRPMVTLSTVKRYDTSPNVNTPTGSSGISHYDPSLTVYEINEITATGKPRFIGVTKDYRPGVLLENSLSYSLDNNIASPTGDIDIAYDDGVTTVFKKRETRAIGRPRQIGVTKDYRPGVLLENTQSYSLDNNISTPTGDVDIAFEDGVTTVFKKGEIRAIGRPRQIAVTKDARLGYTLENTQSYSLDANITSPTGDADIVYDDGVTTVFKKSELRAVPKETAGGTEITSAPGYRIRSSINYGPSNTIGTPTGSARATFTDGTVTIYQREERTLEPVPLTFESGRSKSPLIERRTVSRFSTSPAINTDNGQSSIAQTDGTTHVYEVREETFVAQAPREYPILLQAAVPSVLLGINYIPIAKLDGSSEWAVSPILEEGYRGTFQGKVREYWSATPPPTDSFQPITFRPSPIIFNGARLNFSLAETLHGSRSITETIGNTDPEYAQQSISMSYPATVPPAIPTGWQPYAMESDPMENGGYRVREIYIKYK